jgi:hypothetical protein
MKSASDIVRIAAADKERLKLSYNHQSCFLVAHGENQISTQSECLHKISVFTVNLFALEHINANLADLFRDLFATPLPRRSAQDLCFVGNEQRDSTEIPIPMWL